MARRKKIYIQFEVGGKEEFWTISDSARRKRYGGKLHEGYENYLCEHLAIKCGYEPYHGSLVEVARATDCMTKITYITYTLLVK